MLNFLITRMSLDGDAFTAIAPFPVLSWGHNIWNYSPLELGKQFAYVIRYFRNTPIKHISPPITNKMGPTAALIMGTIVRNEPTINKHPPTIIIVCNLLVSIKTKSQR